MSLMSVIYLLIFPLSSTVLHSVSGLVVVLAFFSSVSLYLFPFEVVQRIKHKDRVFYFSIVFVVIVAVLSTALSGIDHMASKKLGKFVYLLMVIPVYYYFKTVRIKPEWIWYGLALGAIISALVGVYQITNGIYYDPKYRGRAYGVTHPIIYGNLALLMGVMSLAGLSWFKSQGRWFTLLPVVAVICGLLASILSQSRGGWVAIPFLAIVFLRFSSLHLSKLKILLSLVVVGSIFVAAYHVPQSGVKVRMDRTIDNMQKYFTVKEMKTAGGTSVTSRFEMWQASWSIFIDNPLIGVGWGHYQENAKILVSKGERNKSISNWSHPHNQYFSAMVSGGVFALLAIILLFFIPSRIFYNACRSPEKSDDTKAIALAGLLLMVGFIIFNMSESLLERSRTVSFFIFYLALFMAGIRDPGDEVFNHNDDKKVIAH
ncbi:MAG: hypothetical protein DIZ80_13955 [endosymbiont of Galathealinum brachiosum]|uniref:O-antigen ligase-related domain-containing protein n=1 Tax=endosymbiont of Galathealinum brachiosum TaxID=2200906 RepID=A0A370DAK3_9GAMM|nr:MAG: hypothetical protein DIZ80_13955 [endosymbiont of Galathealinum brachiosum]